MTYSEWTSHFQLAPYLNLKFLPTILLYLNSNQKVRWQLPLSHFLEGWTARWPRAIFYTSLNPHVSLFSFIRVKLVKVDVNRYARANKLEETRWGLTNTQKASEYEHVSSFSQWYASSSFASLLIINLFFSRIQGNWKAQNRWGRCNFQQAPSTSRGEHIDFRAVSS